MNPRWSEVFKLKFIVQLKKWVKGRPVPLSFSSWYRLNRMLNFPLQRMAFRRAHGYSPNFKSPRSFNEKLVARVLYRRDHLFPLISDKFAVRDFVKTRSPTCRLIPILQVWSSADDIDFNSIDYPAVFKTNYQSGTNRMIFDPNAADLERIRSHFRFHLSEVAVRMYRYYELVWWVREIKPTIISEKMLLAPDGKPPKDYKFHMFDGELGLLQVYNDHVQNEDGHGRGTTSVFDKNLIYIDIGWKRDAGGPVKLPNNIDCMVEIARELSKDFDYMRVDLYNIDGHIFFAELTPFHTGGGGRFSDTSFDFKLGESWNYVS